MSTNRTRLAIVSGTALTLVLTGASIVAAQTPDTLNAGDGPGISALRGDGRGDGGRGFGGRGGRDIGGGLGERIVDRYENLVSQETVTIDADGNALTSLVQHGTVSAVADGSITITLATGESATIATDANTTAYSWSTSGRPSRTETALADIAVGADVLVSSQSQDDGSFLAERVAVLPVATDDTTTEEVAPEASPAAVG